MLHWLLPFVKSDYRDTPFLSVLTPQRRTIWSLPMHLHNMYTPLLMNKLHMYLVLAVPMISVGTSLVALLVPDYQSKLYLLVVIAAEPPPSCSSDCKSN